MKSTIELMQVKGVKVPNFNEPKGMEFEKAMNEIDAKVHKQTARKNGSINQINKVKEQLNKVQAGILMAEDDFEEMELKKRKKYLQEELDSIDDYSSLNVQEYAKKLINNSAIQTLQAEAKSEYLNIRTAAKDYEKELEKQYTQAKKELQRFNADMGSESNYRTGARSFNSYETA